MRALARSRRKASGRRRPCAISATSSPMPEIFPAGRTITRMCDVLVTESQGNRPSIIQVSVPLTRGPPARGGLSSIRAWIAQRRGPIPGNSHQPCPTVSIRCRGRKRWPLSSLAQSRPATEINLGKSRVGCLEVACPRPGLHSRDDVRPFRAARACIPPERLTLSGGWRVGPGSTGRAFRKRCTR